MNEANYTKTNFIIIIPNCFFLKYIKLNNINCNNKDEKFKKLNSSLVD